MATNKNFIVKNGLEVGGDLIVTGSLQTSVLTLPASDGTSGQVIVTDGSGNLSFQTIVSNFTISDGTNTDTFNTGETLTFTAGTGITTTVSNNVVTIEGVAQYDDADAVAAIESHPHLTIDGGTLYVDTANDYVGIGDTSPQHKLDVAGAIGVNGTAVIDSTSEVITAQLKDSGVTAGTYGSATFVPVITVDAKGRVTSASATTVAGVSSFTYNTSSEILNISTADGGSFNADISSLASQTYVDTAVAGLVDSAPGTLDTLNELAAALGDDPNFATTIATAINGKVEKTGDTMTGNLSFGDNNKAIFGAGSDLQIYHSGQHSYIKDTGQGNLTITAGNFYVNNAADNQNMISAINGGATSIMYNGGTKLATTSTGIDVTGSVKSSRLTSQRDASNVFVDFVDTGVANDTTGDVVIQGYYPIKFKTDLANDRMEIARNGDISFYEDTGTSAKFFWDSSAESLGIGTTTPAYDLDVRDGIVFAGRAVSDAGSISYTNTAAVFSSRGVDQDASETNILRLLRDGTSGVQYAGVADFNMSEWESVGVNSRTQLTLNLGHGDLNSAETTDVMTWRSNGNVGIGTTSPDFTVDVTHQATGQTDVMRLKGHTGNAFVRFQDNDNSADWTFGSDDNAGAGAGALIAYDRNNSAYRFVINSSGNVGIGTTSPDYKFDVAGSVRLAQTSSTAATLVIGGHQDGRLINFQSGGSTRFYIYGGATGDDCLDFRESNDQSMLKMYDAEGVVINEDGTTHNFRVESDNNANILFVDGGNDRVCIGHSSTGLFTASARFEVDATSNSRTAGITTKSSALCLGLWNTNNSSGDMIQFSYGTNGTDVGSITHNGSGVTYNTTSDRRLKDNIQPIVDATDKLMDMKPVTHTWIDNPKAPQVHGFIAQEMQEVVPEAVSGDPDSDQMMSMDYGRITPVIVAALQDALKEIEELKTRIKTLEAK